MVPKSTVSKCTVTLANNAAVASVNNSAVAVGKCCSYQSRDPWICNDYMCILTPLHPRHDFRKS